MSALLKYFCEGSHQMVVEGTILDALCFEWKPDKALEVCERLGWDIEDIRIRKSMWAEACVWYGPSPVTTITGSRCLQKIYRVLMRTGESLNLRMIKVKE